MTKIKKVTTRSDQETFDLGRNLGAHLIGGQVIALSGCLGAGKTKFVQGLARGLGVVVKVNSPTFNILKVYLTKHKSIKTLCHVDAYRLQSENDLRVLGIDEFFESPVTVTVIEWADKVKKILPRDTIFIDIQLLKKNERRLIIKWT